MTILGGMAQTTTEDHPAQLAGPNTESQNEGQNEGQNEDQNEGQNATSSARVRTPS
jgi:hypothetical protein